MDFELTEHARESLRERPNIRMTWVEQVLRDPEHSEPDSIDPDLEHRLGRIDECEGRVLRVIVNRAVSPLKIVTVYFDRAMRNKLMKLAIDEEADALHLELVAVPVVESEEVAPGVIVDYDEFGQVVGVEILHLSKRSQPVNMMDFQFHTTPKKPASAAA